MYGHWDQCYYDHGTYCNSEGLLWSNYTQCYVYCECQEVNPRPTCYDEWQSFSTSYPCYQPMAIVNGVSGFKEDPQLLDSSSGVVSIAQLISWRSLYLNTLAELTGDIVLAEHHWQCDLHRIEEVHVFSRGRQS